MDVKNTEILKSQIEISNSNTKFSKILFSILNFLDSIWMV